MDRLCFENSQHTSRTAAMPSRPRKRSMVVSLSYHFENQLALIRRGRGNAEGVLHHLGRFFDMLVTGVVETAEDAARVHLLADLHLENHADGGIDDILFGVAAGADEIGSLADVFGVDDADVAATRRGDLARAGGIGEQLEAIEYLGIAALRLNDLFEFPVPGAVEEPFLRFLAGFVEGLGDFAQE